ncbi:MAG: aspartate dehydrogenase [Thermoplasmatota archaeon]
MKVGIIGCGFIGTTISGALDQMERIETLNLLDIDYERSIDLSSKLEKGFVFKIDDYQDFLEASDLIVEAASQKVVVEMIPEAVRRGRDVMILSVGALVDDELWEAIRKEAAVKGSKVFIPSGAVSGIDGIFSASKADIECITLTVRKPPAGLSLPPSMHERSAELKSMKGALTLFDGSAREAVREFPKNVNVAATVALAGIGFDRTRVVIIADPSVQRNRQTIEVRGRFGEMKIEMMNQPSTTNPRTSYLAPLSAVAMIEKLISGVYIGN